MTEAKKRIYAVVSKVMARTPGKDDATIVETRLVRAKTAQGAINHVVADRITAAVPTQDELFAFAGQGLKVEDSEG